MTAVLEVIKLSKSFDGMPAQLRDYVVRRFHEILSGEDKSGGFGYIPASDRQAILEILHDTKPGF